MRDKKILQNCIGLRKAFLEGLLGRMDMPEDTAPEFTKSQIEERLVYFTLPMSLNYQRNSYSLWEAATQTYLDKSTSKVFSVKASAKMGENELRKLLVKYKVALQPNKHVNTWQRLATVFYENWGTIENFLKKPIMIFVKFNKLSRRI